MPSICRHKDRGNTGHLCSTTAPVLATQRTVFANNRPIARRGDPAGPHKILKPGKPPKCIGHKAKLNRGSLKVFVANKGVGRHNDSFDRGKMQPGSRDVFAG